VTPPPVQYSFVCCVFCRKRVQFIDSAISTESLNFNCHPNNQV
jgi:hypothetical protein